MCRFRVGTTSYIIPDDILPNVRYLANLVQDVELILFEVDDGPNNLPSPEIVNELARLAADHDLTYTVHLPLDLRLGSGGPDGHVSLIKARRVIDRTRSLAPWAYVLHLDGKEIKDSADRAARQRWQDQSVEALTLVAEWVGGPHLLAVENLEGYPLDFLTPVLDRIAVSRCVDVGHLWLEGYDPRPYLEEALPRTRVIHLHGIREWDHKSIACQPPALLDASIALLCSANYEGVVTLEVFDKEDFTTSHLALRGSLQRVRESARGLDTASVF